MTEGEAARTRDAAIAVRNAMIVGASLVVTWSVALLVRLVLPRSLGPEVFGEYSFADALALNGLSFVGLGVDSYIQKEIPARPEHASDFFGGTQLLRAVMSLVVFVSIAFVAHVGGHGRDVVLTTLVFGVAQLCSIAANTCATLLYAARSVGRLSALNIGTKVLWGVGVGVGMILHAPLPFFALATVASELTRLSVLLWIARRVTGLRVRVDMTRTLSMLKLSVPFYLANVSQVLYSKIDVAIMGLTLSDREVGWYGAATNISNVAMMVSPLMGWVLMPQLSRAAATGRDELMRMLRRALELTFVTAIGLAVLLAVGADVIVHVVFGAKFEPAIGAIRWLSPIFVVVYLAMLGASALILLNRSWTVTIVTIVSLVVNGALNIVLLGPAVRALGDGGGGMAAAVISVATEAVVAGIYLWLLRRDAFDSRNLSALGKSLFACVVVVGLDRALANVGSWRVIADALAYLLIVIVTRALRIRELWDLVRSAMRLRGQNAIS